VLLRIDGREIADLREFSMLLKTLRPGQTVEATLKRGAEELTVEVTVVER
jgi:S1-C subfamily serine protease